VTQRKLQVRQQLRLGHRLPQAQLRHLRARHKQQQLMQPKLQVRLPPKRVRKLPLQPQAQLRQQRPERRKQQVTQRKLQVRQQLKLGRKLPQAPLQ
jgi:hypothetical protein